MNRLLVQLRVFSALMLSGMIGACSPVSDSNLRDITGINDQSSTIIANAASPAPSLSPTPVPTVLKVLKIVSAGSGSQAAIEDLSTGVGNPISMKAALFDFEGNYLSDAPALWSLSSQAFPSGNLSVATASITNAFTPSLPGTVLVNAIYTGTDPSVVGAFDSTGMITVSVLQAPYAVLSVGGTGQTGVINSILTQPLQLKVLDALSQPIQGLSVSFSVIEGSGSIIGANPVLTDASGVASVSVKLGTTAGSDLNVFRATVVGSPSLYFDYSAVATAGSAHHLTFTTQPALMVAGTAFGVQPTVEVRDGYNNLVSSNGTVTMSKVSGTGTLGGTLTAALSNGIATFSNLSYSVAESGVVLRATFGSWTGDSHVLTVAAAPAPTPTPFPPDVISVFGGNGQSAAMGTALSNPLVAKVVDQNGNPVSGISVTFAVASGGGSISTPQPVISDSNGQVSSIVTVGPSSGTNTFTATMASGSVTVANFSASSANPTTMKVLKIVNSGTGSQATIDDLSAGVGNPISMKAALFDMAGTYLSDAPALWSLSNQLFPSSNLSVSGSSVTNTFTPSRPGTLMVNAIYTGTDASVVGTFDSTGTITVTNVQVPNSILIVAGTSQNGVVNNNLTLPLQVKILDEYAQPIQGVSVNFTVTQGSGAIIGTNPTITDASGVASATVKLGTLAGIGNNSYRATVVGYPAIYADFSATAVAGPQHHLTFTTQPALMFSGTAFGVQPVVELRDEYQNLVTASGTITMSKLTGTGALGGTLTATMTSGIATFSNLSYNVAESGVVLRASNGTVTGDSNSLTVGSAPPGACAVNDGTFMTSDGGCKDIATGLVWSQAGSSTMVWYNVIWDNQLSGSPMMDVNDFGRGNDYVENVSTEECGAYCDNATNTSHSGLINILAYCKSLNEGGKGDWRVPTRSELSSMYSNGGSTHLSGTMNRFYWTSSTLPSSRDTAYTVRLSDGLLAGVRKHDGYNFGTGSVTSAYPICIRGGSRVDADSLNVLSGPTVIGVNQITHPSYPLLVVVKDSNGNRINASGRTITISAASSGSVGGTATAITDYSGLATFKNFTLNATGNIVITISGSGLASVNHTIKVINESVGGPCLLENGQFQTTQGGCKDLTTGLVWSSPATSNIGWYSAIWDSSLSGATLSDADDYGRTSDYAENFANEDCGNYCDNSTNANGLTYVNTLAFCKNLNEGGRTDWRLPSRSELLSLANNGGSTVISGDLTRFYWTSSTHFSDKGNAYGVRLSDGLLGSIRKFDGYNFTMGIGTNNTAICVRGGRTQVSSLSFVQVPDLIGINSVPPTSLKVQVEDSLGNKAYAAGISITVGSSTATVSGTATATTNYQGIASLDSFLLNGSAGSVSLTVSSSGLSNASTTSQLRVGLGPHLCFLESTRFKSQNGGCQDLDNDLVWSTSSSNANTWHQAVWDSATSGSPPQDAFDYGRLSDYDTDPTYQTNASNLDVSASAYCKNLVEAGYSDWRLPTYSEWNNVVIGNVAKTHFSKSVIAASSGSGPGCYWSSSSHATDKTQAFYVGLSAGTFSTTTKSSSTLSNGVACDGQSALKNIRVVCVRDPTP